MFLTLNDICEKFLPGVSVKTASNCRSKADGFPEMRDGRRYDVRKVLEFYASTVPATYRIARLAKAALAKMDEDGQERIPAPDPVAVPAPETSSDQPQDYAAQLDNLRLAATRAFRCWQELDADPEADPLVVSKALKSYVTIMETLRKMEMDNLDYQKRQGEVLLLSEVQDAVARLVGNVLQKLLALPALLAPQLKGQTSQARIKKILDDAIRRTVDGLQKRPF